MEFTTYKCADVSSTHITLEDMQYLEQIADYRFEARKHVPRVADYDTGVFVILGDKDWYETHFNDPDASKNVPVSDCCKRLIQECIRQDIYILRIDTDGYEVEGMPTFEW